MVRTKAQGCVSVQSTFSILGIVLLCSGCTSGLKKQVAVEKKVRKNLEQHVVVLKKQLLQLKEENGLLSSAIEHRQLNSVQDLPEAPSAAESSVEAQNERLLYTKVTAAFRDSRSADLQAFSRLFLQAFPSSSLKPNIQYIQALESYRQGQYAESLKFLDEVIKNPVTSDFLRIARTAKSVVYRKLNLKEQALFQLKQNQPGQVRR